MRSETITARHIPADGYILPKHVIKTHKTWTTCKHNIPQLNSCIIELYYIQTRLTTVAERCHNAVWQCQSAHCHPHRWKHLPVLKLCIVLLRLLLTVTCFVHWEAAISPVTKKWKWQFMHGQSLNQNHFFSVGIHKLVDCLTLFILIVILLFNKKFWILVTCSRIIS
jgi:hypothetical protein